MNHSFDKIYAPSIFLFAFQPQGTVEEDNLTKLEQRYRQLFKIFGVKDEVVLRRDSPSESFDLLDTPNAIKARGIRRYYQHFTGNLPSGLEIEGFIYPQAIEDYYALNFNIFYPENIGRDEISLESLKNFNPDRCFFPDPQDLGQTILITAFLAQNKPAHPLELEALATECILDFWGITNPEKCPKLSDFRELLGGYIYEYGQATDSPEKNPFGQLLVWFFFEEKTSKILHKSYGYVPELLLCYHKAIKTYHQSRQQTQLAQIKLRSLQQLLENWQTPWMQQGDFKHLLKLTTEYSQHLLHLEASINQISLATYHYEQILANLQKLTQNNLPFLGNFAEIQSKILQEEIAANLRYLSRGGEMLDRAIALWRGKIEQNQTKQTPLIILSLGLILILAWQIFF